jgi:hypothetical protein
MTQKKPPKTASRKNAMHELVNCAISQRVIERDAVVDAKSDVLIEHAKKCHAIDAVASFHVAVIQSGLAKQFLEDFEVTFVIAFRD